LRGLFPHSIVSGLFPTVPSHDKLFPPYFFPIALVFVLWKLEASDITYPSTCWGGGGVCTKFPPLNGPLRIPFGLGSLVLVNAIFRCMVVPYFTFCQSLTIFLIGQLDPSFFFTVAKWPLVPCHFQQRDLPLLPPPTFGTAVTRLNTPFFFLSVLREDEYQDFWDFSFEVLPPPSPFLTLRVRCGL